MEYRELTPEWWDGRCLQQVGFHKVMNTGISLSECLAETTRQTNMLLDDLDAYVPWGKAHYLYDSTGKPYKAEIVRPPTLKLLDVGCGVGRLTSVLAGAVLETTGLDWSWQMLNVAEQNYRGITWKRGDVAGPRNLFGAGRFDVALAWGLFCHLVTESQFKKAAGNVAAWAERVVLVDKFTGESTTPYTRVWSVEAVRAAFAPLDVTYMQEYNVTSGRRVVDVFTVLVMEKPVRRKPKEDAPVEEDAHGDNDPAE